jgi:ribonuclease-3
MPVWLLKNMNLRMRSGSKVKDTTAVLLKLLGWPAQNLDLYQQALTHSSYANEAENIQSNERLEFLGDAVLGLVVSEELFKAFPGFSEGKLTLMLHNIVNEESLARLARGINLGSYIRFGKGELASKGFNKQSLLADALGALIGALFLDVGFSRARPLVLDLFRPLLMDTKKENFIFADYKTLLQEMCQLQLEEIPVYEIISDFGPPHDKTFVAVVKFAGKIMGKGKGKSKKEAEKSAAKKAYQYFTGKN